MGVLIYKQKRHDGPNQMGGEATVALLRGVPFESGLSKSITPYTPPKGPGHGRHTRVEG
jgi:hypothetical protein